MSTIAVSEEVRDVVRDLSHREKLPASKIIEEALRLYKEEYPNKGMYSSTDIPKRGRPKLSNPLDVGDSGFDEFETTHEMKKLLQSI